MINLLFFLYNKWEKIREKGKGKKRKMRERERYRGKREKIERE